MAAHFLENLMSNYIADCLNELNWENDLQNFVPVTVTCRLVYAPLHRGFGKHNLKSRLTSENFGTYQILLSLLYKVLSVYCIFFFKFLTTKIISSKAIFLCFLFPNHLFLVLCASAFILLYAMFTQCQKLHGTWIQH